MMHQRIDEDPAPGRLKIAKSHALELLEELSEKFDGSIVLRRYSRNTLMCDTLVGRLLGLDINNGGYRKIHEPLWIVVVKRKAQKILGRGASPEEAIQNAVESVGGISVW